MRHLLAFYLKQFLSRKETWVWVLAMPILFSVFFGLIFKDTGSPVTRAGSLRIINLDNGPVSRAMLDDLEQFGYTLVDDPAGEVDGEMTIPDGFSQGFLNGNAPKVIIRFPDKTGDAKKMQLNVFLAHFMVRTVRAITTLPASGQTPDEATYLSAYHRPPGVRLHTQAGERKRIPDGFNNSFAANLVMFLILNVLIYGGIILRQDLDNGITKRILVSPVGRWRFLGAAVLFRTMVGVIQALILLGIGRLIFKVGYLTATPWLVPLIILFSLSIAMLSMLLAALVTRMERVTFAALLVTLPLAALGGCWWPLEIMPEFWQRLAWYLPTGNLMSVFNRIFIGPVTWIDLWPHALYSVVLTIGFGFLALRLLARKLS